MRLEPGLAFGSGRHPTTAMCLRWLDSQVLAGRYILDFGCGSGVLLIAARALGTDGPLLSVDHDPQALKATAENARENGVQIDIADHVGINQRFDIVQANVVAATLIEMSESPTSYTKRSGWIVLSGISEKQVAGVLAAYSKFNLEPIAREGTWVLVAGRRVC